MIAFEQMLKKAEHARITVKTVVEPVAEALGNTPAISRKSYVHPALLEAVKEDARDPLDGMERPQGRKRLSSAEVGLLDFLARSGKRRRKCKGTRQDSRRRLIAAALTGKTACDGGGQALGLVRRQP